MEQKSVKHKKNTSRKTVFGIKLPPIEAKDSEDVKTIVDIDPDYYSLVEGRPLRPNTSIHKYKQCIKEVARKRALHGFLVDEIIRIDREIENERNIYETASQHFDEYKTSFDKFLADDNNKTIAIMRKSDMLAKDLTNQTELHKKANYELASIKSKLQYIDESLLILLTYENFLHRASPILWQTANNITLDTKHSEIIKIDSDVFHTVDINTVAERLSKLSAPRLYFELPNQLLSIFALLEKQNLNYLLVTEELNSEKKKFLDVVLFLKRMLCVELDYIQQKIKEIEEIISWNEYREIEVKDIFFRILEEKIRYLVSSETALQIYNYIEYTYEQLLASNETKLSLLDMTLCIETEYDNLMLDISAFDLDFIKKIEKETYENGEREIKQAKTAGKLLKDVDKLSKRLKSSYEPAKNKTI